MGVLSFLKFTPSTSVSRLPYYQAGYYRDVHTQSDEAVCRSGAGEYLRGADHVQDEVDSPRRLIKSKEKSKVQLIYKGLKPGQAPPLKDRFSVVLAVAPSNTANPEKMWSSHNAQAKMANSEMRRKKLAVLYVGYNDKLPVVLSDEDDQSRVDRVVKKRPGQMDEQPKAAPAPAPAGKNMPVVVMFRERPKDDDSSRSGSEDEDDKTDAAPAETPGDAQTCPIAPPK